MATPQDQGSSSASPPQPKPAAFAYATLLTNDAYLPAALTLAQSLRSTHTRHPLLVLVDAANVSSSTRQRLAALFDEIVPVDAVAGVSQRNLALIGRPDLATTLTKLRLWALRQYKRVLYLDADTLVLASLDHLFAGLPPGVDFAASPELGFPDCFNAGFMLLTPDESTYQDLLALARTEESFDGGDQGLLNVFFGDGTRNHPAKTAIQQHQQAQVPSSSSPSAPSPPARNWYRLSYTYNMEMHKVFRMYIPAVLRYRDEHKVLHFIGKDKPWHFDDGRVDVPDDASEYFKFYAEMVGRWWEVWRGVKQAAGEL